MNTPAGDDMDKYVQDRYSAAIKYYWTASRSNKNWYKRTRYLTVIIGATVTLIASLTSSSIIEQSPSLKVVFAIGTPILAATLTIVTGFSQSFQYGSAWQNMVLTAQHLQKEFDRYLVTPKDQRKHAEEVEKLNTFVLEETKGFFERILGGTRPSTSVPKPDEN